MKARRNLLALLIPLALLLGCDASTSAELSMPVAAADARATPTPF